MCDKEHVAENRFTRRRSLPLHRNRRHGACCRHEGSRSSWGVPTPHPDRQTDTQSSEATAGAAAKRGRKAFLGIHLFLLSGNEAQKWTTGYSGQCWNCQRNGFFTLLPSPQPFATTSAPSHAVPLQFLAHLSLWEISLATEGSLWVTVESFFLGLSHLLTDRTPSSTQTDGSDGRNFSAVSESRRNLHALLNAELLRAQALKGSLSYFCCTQTMRK